MVTVPADRISFHLPVRTNDVATMEARVYGVRESKFSSSNLGRKNVKSLIPAIS